MGEHAENTFAQLLSKRGTVRPATKSEQFTHVDFVLTTTDKKSIKYEVKARKRINRSDSQVNDDLIWVEWLNVSGNPGWLATGSDYICFEREKDFLIVDRRKLHEWCLNQCDMSSLVQFASQALYKAYQRRGRKDLISIIKTTDVEKLAEDVWAK